MVKASHRFLLLLLIGGPQSQTKALLLSDSTWLLISSQLEEAAAERMMNKQDKIIKTPTYRKLEALKKCKKVARVAVDGRGGG